jgi:hypothetical protein
VQVRVVARIKRAMMFESGKPVLRNLDGSWAIRGNSYDFKVEPMAEQQEMIAIKPHDQDFSLPPGRYALVLQGQAYDFTVEGKVGDSAHCLERVEAQNGAVYSECRAP